MALKQQSELVQIVILFEGGVFKEALQMHVHRVFDTKTKRLVAEPKPSQSPITKENMAGLVDEQAAAMMEQIAKLKATLEAREEQMSGVGEALQKSLKANATANDALAALTETTKSQATEVVAKQKHIDALEASPTT